MSLEHFVERIPLIYEECISLNCTLHFLVVCCSKCPLQENAYEKIHVYVAPSTISPLAGEGLFARKTFKKGQLICLFNGIRWRKEGRRPKAIQAGSEDWSDYRLTLGTRFVY